MEKARARRTTLPLGWGLEHSLDRDALLELEFWEMQAALYDETSVIIDGQHYRLGAADSKFKGFGGTTFEINFFDGRHVVCKNLWSQGSIDPEYRDRLKDNATFVGTPFHRG